MKLPVIIVISWLAVPGLAQEIVLPGNVLDAKTKLPLVNAAVRMKNHALGTYTDHAGKFGLPLPDSFLEDTLMISYVGYKTRKIVVARTGIIDNTYLLEESPTVLDEVTILARRKDKFEIKKLESSMRLVRGNLYASNIELTNKEYNKFLSYLLQTDQNKLYQKYKPDISAHQGSMLSFFKGYHIEPDDSRESAYEYGDYPVVNITHDAALAYCEWLTRQYNNSKGKKKYKQAVFRLPTLSEWQITALGYPRFQSWNLEENEIEVRIPDKPGEMLGARKKTIPFKGSDIRYPWHGGYEYRNKPQNNKNCWLGNFSVPEGAVSCYIYRPGGDGYSIIGKCASYFPNDMGFYDVVGNVAEMIDEKGKACGGSWNHPPEESTLTSILNYSGTTGFVGFRIFMEAGQ